MRGGNTFVRLFDRSAYVVRVFAFHCLVFFQYPLSARNCIRLFSYHWICWLLFAFSARFCVLNHSHRVAIHNRGSTGHTPKAIAEWDAAGAGDCVRAEGPRAENCVLPSTPPPGNLAGREPLITSRILSCEFSM